MRKSLLTMISMFAFVAGISAQAAKSTTDTGVKVKGFVRVRPELKQNSGFTESKNAADATQFVGQKAQVQISKKFNDSSSVKVTIQDARVWGGAAASKQGYTNGGLTSSVELQATDIREAYLDLKNILGSGLDIQLGRQILNYGTQRFVGGLDWTNVGRSFDAVRFKYDIDKVNTFHAWSSLSNENDNDSVGNNTANTKDILFNGIYNSYKGLGFAKIDTYYISVLDTSASQADKLHTVGGRFYMVPKKGELGLDLEIEGLYQFGTTGNFDANGNAIEYGGMAGVLVAGYTFDAGLKIRVGAELGVGTGDKASTAGKSETFKNLYPTNHLFYGYADLISLQNAILGELVVKVFINKTSNFRFGYVYAAKDVVSDNWYNVGGGVDAGLTALVAPSSKKQLFHEIDLTYTVNPTKYLAIQAGFAYVFRGDALTDSLVNARTDYIFSYLSTSVKF